MLRLSSARPTLRCLPARQANTIRRLHSAPGTAADAAPGTAADASECSSIFSRSHLTKRGHRAWSSRLVVTRQCVPQCFAPSLFEGSANPLASKHAATSPLLCARRHEYDARSTFSTSKGSLPAPISLHADLAYNR